MAKWGTVNEPNKKGRYLVTIETSFGRQVRQANRKQYWNGTWGWFVLHGSDGSDKVIAWQKCPEPYEG